MPDKPNRRRFLEATTLCVGGALGAATFAPLGRYLIYPVGRSIVAGSGNLVDVVSVADVQQSKGPLRVELVTDRLRDAWATAEKVVVGGAWVDRDDKGGIRAFTTACPHLGCAVAFAPEDNEYRCPCHKSAFARTGEKKSGPSKRGLDPLPVTVEDGRVKLRIVRYRPDVPEREPV